MQSTRPSSMQQEVLLRGVVWALIGVIFGLLFVMLSESFVGRIDAPYSVVLAIAGGAALTALFYGSMRLTVLVANFTFIAMLAYIWWADTPLMLDPLVFIGAGVGLSVGAWYGRSDKQSRVYCAEAKIIAGAVSGLLGGGLTLALLQIPGLHAETLVILIAPLTVLAYIKISGWFISRCHHLLPPVVDGAIVGLGVGSVTGILFVIMAGTLDAQLLRSDEVRDFVVRVEQGLPPILFGCAALCFVVGAIRALLGVPWYNR